MAVETAGVVLLHEEIICRLYLLCQCCHPNTHQQEIDNVQSILKAALVSCAGLLREISISMQR